LIQPTDQEIIQASIGYYHGEVWIAKYGISRDINTEVCCL
jgi:hypothetical protein